MKNNKIHRTPILRIIFIIFIYFVQTSALSSVVTTIPDVKFKSSMHETHTSNDNLSTTQFKKKDIQKSPTTTLNQLLKQEQSIIQLVNHSGDTSQTALSLRGFGDNAVANSLILVDGFPLTNPSLLAPNFNSIPLSDIDHIDIYQGSQGVLWGDQAVGGVVSITTLHPKHFSLSSQLAIGSYRSYYANILVGDQSLNGIFYKLFVLANGSDQYRQHNQMNSNNGAIQFGVDYNSGSIYFNLHSDGNLTYFAGPLSEEQFYLHPRQATGFHNYSRYRTNYFQIFNTQIINNQWFLETRLEHHTTEGDGFIFLNFDRSDSLTSINPRLIGSIYYTKIIFGYLGQISYYHLANKLVHTRVNSQQNNIYTEISLMLVQPLDLILGVRKAWQVNRIEAGTGKSVKDLNQVLVSELGLSYHPIQELSFFIRRNDNFSFPKANEEVWLPDSIESLQPQTGTSYETGAKWQTESDLLQINLYQLFLNHEIVFNPLPSITQPFGAYSNINKTIRRGISLSQMHKLSNAMSINGQFNTVDARFASGPFVGNHIPAVPNYTANGGLRYALTEHIFANYYLLYSGSRYASEDMQNKGKKVSGYWLHNIAIQYTKLSSLLSFEINNLFNKHYAHYVFYDVVTGKNSYYSAAGRNYLATLKFNL